jgi:DNA-binding transcriptional regulator YiaG
MLLTTVTKYVIIGDTLYEVELSYNQGAMMEKLQQKVKALRLKKGWAQEDLARQINVSLSTVQRWESKGAKPTRLARQELMRLFKETGIEE